MQPLVDAHFAGAIAPADERTMRAHLDGCDACRARYRRRLVLAKLDPEAPGVEARLAQGLGLRASPGRVRALWRVWPALATLAAAAAVLLYVGARRGDGFTARGAQAERPSADLLHVYRVRDGGASPAVVVVGRDDELAFAYENDDAKKYLMVFGVDDRGRVYWFYPAWTRAEDDPKAIEAQAGGGVHDLPEAVRHHVEGSRLEIHALYLDAPRGVHEVEAAVASGILPTLGVDRIQRFRVVP
jgi:hypothetical protein